MRLPVRSGLTGQEKKSQNVREKAAKRESEKRDLLQPFGESKVPHSSRRRSYRRGGGGRPIFKRREHGEGKKTFSGRSLNRKNSEGIFPAAGQREHHWQET